LSTAVIDSVSAQTSSPGDWPNFLMSALLPLAASIFFTMRNLRLGRGDWRGATRIAVFVFVMNILEGATTTRLSEVGLIGAGADIVHGRAFGHALMHAVSMWFAYVALEPYVRRLWPRTLVSWARLLSGRLRDPLVGRDLLIGAVAGSAMTALYLISASVFRHFGLHAVPTLVGWEMPSSLTSLSNTACALSYGGSVCVLEVLGTFVQLLVLRLLFRHTGAAIAATMAIAMGLTLIGAVPTEGWLIGIVGGLFRALPVLILMRFGVLAGVTTAFVALVVNSVVPSLDFSAWYADRALVPLVLLVGILIYGAFTALAGKSLFGDPLREERERGA
ncbi:MAG TPA: hypothetical protein VF720_04090, partial [Candidatus Eisenbacteria bacterium]